MAERPPGRHRRPAVPGAARHRGYKVAAAAVTIAALAAPASADVAVPALTPAAAPVPDSGDQANSFEIPDWEYDPDDGYSAEPQESAEPAPTSEPTTPPVEQLTLAASLAQDPPATENAGQLGIPAIMLAAYQKAEANLDASMPGCGLHWSLLAGIGRIESGHARGGRVDAAGTTLTPILGPELDGRPGFAAISDTDDGEYDRDSVHDRAVGPMQFIPSTWLGYAVDGNGDGIASPHNAFDAATAAGKYLCSDGLDLTDPEQLLQAVYRYNHSMSYVQNVLTWANSYARGVIPQPQIGGGAPSSGGAPGTGATPPGAPPGTPPGSTPPAGSPPGTPPGSSPGTPPATTPPGPTPPATDDPTALPSTEEPPPSTEEPLPSTEESPPSTEDPPPSTDVPPPSTEEPPPTQTPPPSTDPSDPATGGGQVS